MKTFVIADKNNPVSMAFYKTLVKTLEWRYIPHEFFQAVTPDTLASRVPELDFKGKDMTGGRCGCYASHYLLWKKCVELDKKIMIVEHDQILLEDIPGGIERITFLSNEGKNNGFRFYPGQISEPSFNPSQALIITPKEAKFLIEVSTKQPIYNQMDSTYNHYYMRDMTDCDTEYIFTLNVSQPSTIDHPHNV